MKRTLILLVLFASVQFVAAAKKSKDYPLTIRIIGVEERTATTSIRPITTDSNGDVSGGGGGGSYNWKLMVADIEGRRYGLSVTYHSLYGFKIDHHTWLPIGDYAGRRINRNSFEVQFQDDSGKTRIERLDVESMSSSPVAAAPATSAPAPVTVAPVAAPAPLVVPVAAVAAPVVAPAPPAPAAPAVIPADTGSVHGSTIEMNSESSLGELARRAREKKQK